MRLDRRLQKINSQVLLATAAMFFFRICLASFFPMTNDESYYWDWGQDLQLSYYDHPPGVAVLGWLSSNFFSGFLAARGLIPFVHLGSSLFILGCFTRLKGRSLVAHEQWMWFILTQLIPAFSLSGIFLLPDAGLLLALSAALYFILQFSSQEKISSKNGLTLGLCLGLAGLFKYHAAPVGGGMLLGLLIYRRHSIAKDLVFWICVFASGLLICFPVLVWNLQNDFASFRYQSNHGFANASFKPLFALRSFLGQLIFLTPVIGISMVKFVFKKNHPKDSLALIARFAFLPLFLLIECTSFIKQTLPHWVIPAFWILIPFYLNDRDHFSKLQKFNIKIFAPIVLVLPWFLAIYPIRNLILEKMDGNPKALYELTLWPNISTVLSQKNIADAANQDMPSGCPPVYIASLRWFWVAQLRFYLPEQPKIYSLDLNHSSYYNFRDGRFVKGCPILVVGDERHLELEKLNEFVAIKSQESLDIRYHEKMKIFLISGTTK